MKNKRGVSPVVATILLIAIVIVIALIIFLWFKNMNQEAITKFDDKNVKLVCEDLRFQASYSPTQSKLYVRNEGQVPIFQIKAKIYGEGSHHTETIRDNWPSTGLNQGGVYEGNFSAGGGNRAVLIPVLVGMTNKGARASYSCDEKHGYEIVL